MPWCPNCKMGYREGLSVCPGCNVELVDELNISKESDTDYDGEAFLISVNDTEAGIIEELLKTHKIPVLKKYKEAGAYLNIYMGMSLFGVDLYVPSRALEKAKEIIISNQSEGVTEEEYNVQASTEEIEEKADMEKEYGKNRRKVIWIILLLLFIIPAIIIAAISILNILEVNFR